MSAGDAIHVLHLTPVLSRKGGGASAYVWELVRHLRPLGVESTVAGIRDDLTDRDVAGHAARAVLAAEPTLDPSTGLSLDLHARLGNVAADVDVVHAHGLRSGIGLEALWLARRFPGRPLLVTPHGMLYPQLLERSPLRKRLIARLWDDRYLRAARCLHATSPQEADVIRAAGLTQQPVAVVPIGLDVACYGHGDARLLLDRHPHLRRKRLMLFLGIFDRKKGLMRLAEAWGRVCGRFADWHLVLSGPNLDGHQAEVRDALARSGAAHATTFLGGAYGDEKHAALTTAELFVLPSDWENFGIAIAEALASCLPVLTTRGTPWPQIERERCGWWIEPDVDSLASALSNAMEMPPTALQEMGARGRTLIERDYGWPAVAGEMRRVYEWLLGTGVRPNSVT